MKQISLLAIVCFSHGEREAALCLIFVCKLFYLNPGTQCVSHHYTSYT